MFLLLRSMMPGLRLRQPSASRQCLKLSWRTMTFLTKTFERHWPAIGWNSTTDNQLGIDSLTPRTMLSKKNMDVNSCNKFIVSSSVKQARVASNYDSYTIVSIQTCSWSIGLKNSKLSCGTAHLLSFSGLQLVHIEISFTILTGTMRTFFYCACAPELTTFPSCSAADF